MSVKRELVRDLRAHRAELVEDRNELDRQIAGVEAALEALNGDKRMTPRTRAAHGLRRKQVLEFLRSRPDVGWSPAEITDSVKMPASSAIGAVKTLVRDGEVEQVGETESGLPVVKHKPTTIVPGEEVVG